MEVAARRPRVEAVRLKEMVTRKTFQVKKMLFTGSRGSTGYSALTYGPCVNDVRVFR
jgi:hypothetical protein